MAEDDYYGDQFYNDTNLKIKDLEERNRLLRDRLILIGENLIEFREETNKKIVEIKKDLESVKQNIQRMASFLESLSGEFSKFARRDDVEILAKQLKMFKSS